MLRIAGINIPDEKSILIALTYIYGISFTSSGKILESLKIDPSKKTKDLTEVEGNKIRDEISKKLHVEGELKHEVKMNVKRLKDIKCYRGSRHNKGLPVRGQRTKTNNRTVRGNVRKTMGSGRKSAAEKT